MKNPIAMAILYLLIGAAIGAGITYFQVRCKTTGVNIQLQSGGNTPGITVTKTGNDQ